MTDGGMLGEARGRLPRTLGDHRPHIVPTADIDRRRRPADSTAAPSDTPTDRRDDAAGRPAPPGSRRRRRRSRRRACRTRTWISRVGTACSPSHESVSGIAQSGLAVSTTISWPASASARIVARHRGTARDAGRSTLARRWPWAHAQNSVMSAKPASSCRPFQPTTISGRSSDPNSSAWSRIQPALKSHITPSMSMPNRISPRVGRGGPAPFPIVRGVRLPAQRPSRVVVQAVAPIVDGGAFPAKATIGEPVTVTADVFADGHDRAAAALRYRSGRRQWVEIPMTPLGNDRFTATFVPDRLGSWEMQVRGWLDHLGTWRHGLEAKHDAGVATTVDLQIGVQLLDAALATNPTPDDVADAHDAARPAGPGRCHAAVISGAAADGTAPADPQTPDPDLNQDDVEPGDGDAIERLFWRTGVRTPYAELAKPLRLGGRRRASPIQCLVRVLPPLDDRAGDRARHPRRRPRPRRRRRRHGVRRAVPAADPSDRRRPTARAPTTRSRPDRTIPGARGRSAVSRAATSPSIPSSAPSTTSSGWHNGAPSEASHWRSTSRSSAPRITRGSPSIPSGSPTGPTARSSTPRTRPRSTRTSIRSTSNRPTGPTCGSRCATWSSSGSTTASRCSGSTTPTPRRTRSGSG